MNPVYLILGLTFFLLLLLVLFILVLTAVQNQLKHPHIRELQKLRALIPKPKKQKSWTNVSASMYQFLLRVPLIKGFITRIRARLSPLYAEDRTLIDLQAASVAVSALAALLGITLLAFLLVSSGAVRLAIMTAGVYLGGVVADLFIGRREKRLLYGMSSMLLDLRHEYHQTGMVVEALERVAERTSPLIGVHARKIAEVLSSVDPEEELHKYYDAAPNRYAKLLAGVSYMVMENGDGDHRKGEQSLFLNALGKINEEIRLDILRRERLDMQLAGIVFVTFSPLFFIEPLRSWGEGSFPVMGEYYASRAGMYSLILLYLLVLGAFLGLRLIRGFDGSSSEGRAEESWSKRALAVPWIKHIVHRLIPDEQSLAYFRTVKRLRSASAPYSVRDLYLAKLLLAVAVLISAIVIQANIHKTIREQIAYPVPPAATGSDPLEKERSIQQAAFERELFAEILQFPAGTVDVQLWMEQKVQGKGFLPRNHELDSYITSLVEKVEIYHQEFYKWYELIIAFILACTAYSIPDAILIFQRNMRKWEMQNEVDGLAGIVSILSAIPRISVNEMLDWMHRYSHIFEPQLLRCLIDYEAGPWQALERLKDETRFIPLERIIDRLQVAADLIPVKQAFEDIEQERSFELEQRKLKYEQMINRKVSIGKMIGFLPLQAAFLLYLMVPFGYMAFHQLGQLNEITSKL
jgi:hypothetical protein